jgi:hypothetical protein
LPLVVQSQVMRSESETQSEVIHDDTV